MRRFLFMRAPDCGIFQVSVLSAEWIGCLEYFIGCSEERSMKKNLLALVCGITVAISAGAFGAAKLTNTTVRAGVNADGSVSIDKNNFPDDAFREAISEACDKDANGKLSESERAVTTITLGYAEISSFEGLQYFSGLESLTLSNCTMGTLDLSANPKLTQLSLSFYLNNSFSLNHPEQLTYLKIERSLLTELNLAGMTNLETLILDDTLVSTLDLSNSLKLKSLTVCNNRITTLDVSGNKELVTLDANVESRNGAKLVLTSLNLAGAVSLEKINVNNNDIANLSVTNNPALKELRCADNENLTKLDLSGAPALERLEAYHHKCSTLDFTKNPNLKRALVYSRKENNLAIGVLDLTQNQNLIYLDCSSLGITAISFPETNLIQKLICANNKLTSLNLKEATMLSSLDCADNQITNLTLPQDLFYLQELTISNNPVQGLELSTATSLTDLRCVNTSLSSLDVSGCGGLEKIFAQCNSLTSVKLAGADSLKVLDVSDNYLTSLNTTGAPLLQELNCCFNSLTSLTIDQNTSLSSVVCYGNQFSALNLGKIPALKACAEGNRQEVLFEGTNQSTSGYRYTPASGSAYAGSAKIDCDKKVKLELPSLSIRYSEKTIKLGESFQFTAVNAFGQKVSWRTGNTSVATVSANGLGTAKSVANTSLYVSTPDGQTVKCLIKVTYPTLSVRYTEKSLHINQTFKFPIYGAAGKTITWRVGNTSVAKVDQNGKVTGKSAGNTWLYAKSADGREAKCLLRIIDPGTLAVCYTEKTIYLGESFTFYAKNTGILINPTWSIGNTAVATIDGHDSITSPGAPVKAVGVGNTYLTVTTEDGRTAKCLVKVVRGQLSITFTEKTLKEGDAFVFEAKHTAGQKVSWRVGNTSIATVSADGYVKAKLLGNTYLYASTPDGQEVRCLLKITSR